MANLTCGGRCAQIFLILLNTVVLLFGIAFLVVGLIFKFGEQKFLDEKIKPILGDIRLEGNSLYYLADAFTIIFIVVGAVLIAIAIMGLIGAGCLVRWMLVIYASFVILIFILEIVAVAFFFVMRREFDDTITTGMKESIKKANAGNKEVRDGVVYFFDAFKCCHVDNLRLTNETTRCMTIATEVVQDCFKSLKDKFDTISLYFIIMGIVILVIEILCIIFAFWICAQVHRQKLEKVV